MKNSRIGFGEFGSRLPPDRPPKPPSVFRPWKYTTAELLNKRITCAPIENDPLHEKLKKQTDETTN